MRLALSGCRGPGPGAGPRAGPWCVLTDPSALRCTAASSHRPLFISCTGARSFSFPKTFVFNDVCSKAVFLPHFFPSASSFQSN